MLRMGASPDWEFREFVANWSAVITLTGSRSLRLLFLTGTVEPYPWLSCCLFGEERPPDGATIRFSLSVSTLLAPGPPFPPSWIRLPVVLSTNSTNAFGPGAEFSSSRLGGLLPIKPGCLSVGWWGCGGG